MNKLEELHVTPIRKYGLNLNTSGESAKESAEITTNVAIKFALFLKNNCFIDIDTNDKTHWNHNGISYYEPQELFEIFINNYYGK
jgi:hypothetical protein